ncbi:MAG: phospholipid carrier-dependent glycosyltransferase [Patescibacteria group bacterium]
MNFRKIFKEWKWTIFGLVIILMIGLVIRIVNLTILPIFVDEAIYVRWAQVMAIEPTLRFLPLSDGKQPLYMWILMFLIKYFSDPLFIGRLVSVMTGMGTAVGVFVFSYVLFKNKFVSLISLLLYILSPFIFFFDRMALVDSMLSMFGIWTAIFSFLTAKYKRLDLAMIAGFMLGFAALTKSPAMFTALLLPSFWALTNWKGIWRLGVTYFIAFVMYNIQRLGPNFGQLSARTGDYILPISHIWTRFFDPLLPHLKDFVVWLSSMGPVALIPLVLLGIFLGFKKYFKQTLVLVVWGLFPVFIQAELGLTFTARYVFFTLPYLFILAGMSFLIQIKWLRVTIHGLLAFFVIQSIIFDYYLLTNPEKANLPRGERSGYLEEWTAGQGIKEVSLYIRKEELKDKGKQIVVGTEGYFGTLPDGLQLYLNDLPNVIVIGVGVIIDDTPKSLKEAVKAGNKTYLVINKSRYKGKAEEQGLKLIAKYPKGLRLTDSRQYVINGPQEELLFFELTK